MILFNNIYCIFYSLCCFLVFLFCSGCEAEGGQAKPDDGDIDRHVLVTRHNPVLNKADKLSPFTVGNGEFAFTADITGLQTFPEFYSRGNDNSPAPGPDGFISDSMIRGATSLATQSQWGWHTFPNPEGYTLEDATSLYDVNGRKVPYVSGQNTEAGAWLRENPHRLNLARIGFELKTSDGDIVDLEDLENIRQELDLWTGTLNSRFEIEGTWTRRFRGLSGTSGR